MGRARELERSVAAPRGRDDETERLANISHVDLGFFKSIDTIA